MKKLLIAVLGLTLVLASCKKHEDATPYLIFKMKLDSTQVRLDNFGNQITGTDSTESVTPDFKGISSHYIELLPNQFTGLGSGDVVYNMPMTTAGGAGAIDFSQETLANNGEVFFKIPLDSVTPGTYQYLRVSLAYQNYTVPVYVDSSFTYQGYTAVINQSFPCTIASFVGMNTYIPTYQIDDTTITVNGNRLQGYWGARTRGTANVQVGGTTVPSAFTNFVSGLASSTTVSNPLASTSPIPAGSCISTGAFATSAPLVITGNETQSITVEVSLSINHSFEWKKVNTDGKWEPFAGEYVVDMGIRGLIPSVVQ